MRSNECDVIVNMNLLRTYLVSPDSIFDIDSLEDFLESLNILGFQRACYPEVNDELHLSYRFVNPRFVAGEPVPEDLYKHSTSSNKQVKTCSELQISDKQLAHLKLSFALNKTQISSQALPDVIEFSTEEPSYTKNNEIAGYYGDVAIDALQKGFQEFLPIFQQSTEQPSESTVQQEEVACEEVVPSSDEPEKKKRKYNKKSREAIKETAKALLFLQQESLAEPMEH
jgi:hypothetical protein